MIKGLHPHDPVTFRKPQLWTHRLWGDIFDPKHNRCHVLFLSNDHFSIPKKFKKRKNTSRPQIGEKVVSLGRCGLWDDSVPWAALARIGVSQHSAPLGLRLATQTCLPLARTWVVGACSSWCGHLILKKNDYLKRSHCFHCCFRKWQDISIFQWTWRKLNEQNLITGNISTDSWR